MSHEFWFTLAVAVLSLVVAVCGVIATWNAPKVAVRVQRQLDEENEARGRKLWTYKTLMSNRATRMKAEFVQALNLIDLEFVDEDDKYVRTAWRELLNHYNEWGDKKRQTKTFNEEAQLEKANDLFAELLVKMGERLGYDFDKVDVKKGFYYPEGLVNIENEQHALRTAVLNLLSGKGAKLPVAVFEQKFGSITVQPLKDGDSTKL